MNSDPQASREADNADAVGLTVEQALIRAGAWPPTNRANQRRLKRLVRKAQKRKAKAA